MGHWYSHEDIQTKYSMHWYSSSELPGINQRGIMRRKMKLVKDELIFFRGHFLVPLECID